MVFDCVICCLTWKPDLKLILSHVRCFYLFIYLFCQYSLQFCCEYLLWYAPWLMSESCFNCILCCCKRQQGFFNTLWHIVQKNPKRICQVYCTSKSPRRCHFLWRDTWHQLTVTVNQLLRKWKFPTISTFISPLPVHPSVPPLSFSLFK